jgi:ABC-type phosphate/phosphonate transport system permease subunit
MMGPVAALGQAAVVAKARPQDLITGVNGMADILRRSFPPDLQNLRPDLGGVLETFDIALLGTCAALTVRRCTPWSEAERGLPRPGRVVFRKPH